VPEPRLLREQHLRVDRHAPPQLARLADRRVHRHRRDRVGPADRRRERLAGPAQQPRPRVTTVRSRHDPRACNHIRCASASPPQAATTRAQHSRAARSLAISANTSRPTATANIICFARLAHRDRHPPRSAPAGTPLRSPASRRELIRRRRPRVVIRADIDERRAQRRPSSRPRATSATSPRGIVRSTRERPAPRELTERIAADRPPRSSAARRDPATVRQRHQRSSHAQLLRRPRRPRTPRVRRRSTPASRSPSRSPSSQPHRPGAASAGPPRSRRRVAASAAYSGQTIHPPRASSSSRPGSAVGSPKYTGSIVSPSPLREVKRSMGAPFSSRVACARHAAVHAALVLSLLGSLVTVAR
jgi:hypothetical protein